MSLLTTAEILQVAMDTREMDMAPEARRAVIANIEALRPTLQSQWEELSNLLSHMDATVVGHMDALKGGEQ